MWAVANSFKVADASMPHLLFRIVDQISYPAVEYALERLIEFQLIDRVRVDRFDFAVEALEDGDAVADLVKGEQAGFEAIVEVSGAVGNFVGDIDELSFQGRTTIEQIFGEFRELVSRVIVGVLDDPFANFKGQVEPAEGGVAQLEVLHDTQRMQVVIKKVAVLTHGGIERFFPGMAEGWIADVVIPRKGLDPIDVQAELSCDGSSDLRDLDGVSQAIAEVVRVTTGEDLGFSLKTPKRPRVDDAITVALKVVAVRMLRLGITASAGLFHAYGVVGEHFQSLTETALSTQQLALSIQPCRDYGLLILDY